MLSMVAEALSMTTKEPKPTQAEEDELKARAQAALGQIDEHLAKRIARIFDMKGHEAMYGASGNE